MENDGREGDGVYNVNVAGNSTSYPNVHTAIQGQGQTQNQGRDIVGYNEARYPGAARNISYMQPDYTYPNPRPAMDRNINGGYYYNRIGRQYLHNNYFFHRPAHGFYPSLPRPQVQQQQPQTQAVLRPVFDSRRSNRHSSGRNNNNLQAAAGGGRGRVSRDNNNNNTAMPQTMGNIEERLMRMRISEGERSTRSVQGEDHPERHEHANADAGAVVADLSKEYSNGRFLVIKSFSRENVVSSIKHKVWTMSTHWENRILNAAYSEARRTTRNGNAASCPVFLFFSVILLLFSF